MSKHTKEPWWLAKDVDDEFKPRLAEPSDIIADVPYVLNGKKILRVSQLAQMVEGDVDANAARIVACVNACVGVDDPQAMREYFDTCVKCANSHFDYYAYIRPDGWRDIREGDMDSVDDFVMGLFIRMGLWEKHPDNNWYRPVDKEADDD